APRLLGFSVFVSRTGRVTLIGPPAPAGIVPAGALVVSLDPLSPHHWVGTDYPDIDSAFRHSWPCAILPSGHSLSPSVARRTHAKEEPWMLALLLTLLTAPH